MTDIANNASKETTSNTLFERFDKHPKWYVGIALFSYIVVNNTINATSNIMEASRNGATPSFALWEPFSWEYSSAISTLVLIPLLFAWFRFIGLDVTRPLRYVGANVVASLIFSVLHVSIMVALRELVYQVNDASYDFGHIPSEFFYEYRKDAWGFLFFMLLYHVYQFVYSRLKGEATFICEQQEESESTPNHLLVKKLNREFLVKVSEIEWLEAAGNYVNLHAGGRIYPLRSTLSGLLPRLEQRGFTQVHRSQGVNLHHIESISTLPSGDGEIHLKSGVTLTLSRRFKESFKKKLK